MEKRLKKQRNRLFLRVTLILLAVWLAVSATYCGIRIYSEKNNVQQQELSNFTYTKQIIASGMGYNNILNAVFLDHNLLNAQNYDLDNYFDSQIIVTDLKNDEVIADTAKKIGAEYEVSMGEESSTPVYGLVDYDVIRNGLSDSQFRTICGYLSAERSDGKHYELVCTKFHIRYVEFIPLELKIALTSDENEWFISDEITETFTLEKNAIENEEVFECGKMRRNTIPAEFILSGTYNKDYISSLSKEEKKQAVLTVPTGAFEYIFYASDYIYYGSVSDSTVIQYAKQVNLLKNCGRELIIGIVVIFVFFLTIALTHMDQISMDERPGVVSYLLKKLELMNVSVPIFIADDNISMPEGQFQNLVGFNRFRSIVLSWLTNKDRRELTEKWLVTNVNNVLATAAGILSQQKAIADAEGINREEKL